MPIEMNHELMMTPEQAKLWDATNALYAKRIEAIDNKMAGMTVVQLKAYARSVNTSTRGCSVRKDFERAIHARLMDDCATRTGFTRSRGYVTGREVDF